MKTHTRIAIATGVVAIGGLAFVGTGVARGGFGHGPGGFGGGPAMIMEQLDTNQDGKLTQSEIDEGWRSRLAAADTDGDGNLSLDEFQPLLVELMRPRIVDGFQFLDDDGDGAITPEEIQRPVKRVVGHLDRNEDGEITLDEMRPRHRGGWGHGHHGGDGPRGDDDN